VTIDQREAPLALAVVGRESAGNADLSQHAGERVALELGMGAPIAGVVLEVGRGNVSEAYNSIA
jgi:hypothetical protein